MADDDQSPGEMVIRGSALAKMVMGYLANQPDGSDTLHGIAEWWITRQRIRIEVDELSRVLEQLVEDEKLEALGFPGREIYRLRHPPPPLRLVTDSEESAASEQTQRPEQHDAEGEANEGSLMAEKADSTTSHAGPDPVSPAKQIVSAKASTSTSPATTTGGAAVQAATGATVTPPMLEQQLQDLTSQSQTLAATIKDADSEKSGVEAAAKNLQPFVAKKAAVLNDFDAKLPAFQKDTQAFQNFATQMDVVSTAMLGAKKADVDKIISDDATASSAAELKLPGLKTAAKTASDAAAAALEAQATGAADTDAAKSKASLDTRRTMLADLQNKISAAEKAGEPAQMYFLVQEMKTALSESVTDRRTVEQQMDSLLRKQIAQQKDVNDSATAAATAQQGYIAAGKNLADMKAKRRDRILTALKAAPLAAAGGK